MNILELRILPPIAIGRLGASPEAMDAYDLQVTSERPLDYREIVPETSFTIDPLTGAITEYLPSTVVFKDTDSIDSHEGTVRPVAPFLEVYAITDDNPDLLVPLTTDLLTAAGLTIDAISWDVHVANIKLYRRTFNDDDKIEAQFSGIQSHQALELMGQCSNFRSGKALPLGTVQFIAPDAPHPEIRFRYTPGPGLVYGASETRHTSDSATEPDPLFEKYGESFLLYKADGDWVGYQEFGSPSTPEEIAASKLYTNPGSIYAGYTADNGNWTSWGYLDDECDGHVTVHLDTGSGILSARGVIGAGPPAYAPDTLPVRVVSDEIEQILLGPEVSDEVPIDEAEEIIRRALETVRLMNTAVMNGNTYHGKENLASTMVRQDSNDFNRQYAPIMATSLVDNLALRSLHERAFNGLATGASAWFAEVLRKPEEIGDLSDEGRRKMPGMMRGADGRGLCLTRRMISTVIQSGINAMFDPAPIETTGATRSIQKDDVVAQLMHRGTGNPYAVLPRTAISNCFPGLEFDFRNLWRRAFQGITLIENNNYVIDSTLALDLKYHRLVAIQLHDEANDPYWHATMVPTTGPVMPGFGTVTLGNTANPNAVSFMEWSNNMAKLLHNYQGQTVTCAFTPIVSPTEVLFDAAKLEADATSYKVVDLQVNYFFRGETAEIADGILEPGELTQGLCAPWQNDYRECACYYWAASRPDYVNVEPGDNGLSHGDNWMAKERSGQYIPDDRTDSRLLTYDDLFLNWEGELNFLVRGNDATHSDENLSDLNTSVT